MPCTALKIEIFVVQSSFGLGIFRLRADIKNADILAYICIFLRTISENNKPKPTSPYVNAALNIVFFYVTYFSNVNFSHGIFTSFLSEIISSM